jgi:hypothetical protein
VRAVIPVGAGAGALLGFGLLNLIPSLAGGTLGLLIVVGLAILFGALAFLGLFGASLGLMDWLLALIAGVVVAVLFARFLNWALIIFASLVGSMLIVRGSTVAFPDLVDGTLGTIIVVVLTAAGIYYLYRKSQPAAPAAPAAS